MGTIGHYPSELNSDRAIVVSLQSRKIGLISPRKVDYS